MEKIFSIWAYGSAVSHISQIGDASVSLVRDVAVSRGRCGLSCGDAHLSRRSRISHGRCECIPDPRDMWHCFTHLFAYWEWGRIHRHTYLHTEGEDGSTDTSICILRVRMEAHTYVVGNTTFFEYEVVASWKQRGDVILYYGTSVYVYLRTWNYFWNDIFDEWFCLGMSEDWLVEFWHFLFHMMRYRSFREIQ
jgi:hypothetical protein